MMERCTDQLKTITAPPKTVAEAVNRLLTILSNEQKLLIALMSESELVELRPTLGVAISKAFGLGEDNSHLMLECGTKRPAKAAEIIVKEVWKSLTTE